MSGSDSHLEWRDYLIRSAHITFDQDVFLVDLFTSQLLFTKDTFKIKQPSLISSSFKYSFTQSIINSVQDAPHHLFTVRIVCVGCSLRTNCR